MKTIDSSNSAYLNSAWGMMKMMKEDGRKYGLHLLDIDIQS